MSEHEAASALLIDLDGVIYQDRMVPDARKGLNWLRQQQKPAHVPWDFRIIPRLFNQV